MPLTYEAEGLALTIDYDRFDGSRWSYRYTVSALGETIVDRDDLRSGSTTIDRPAPLGEMLATLCDFLSAYYEARQYGTPTSDTWDLFPNALWERVQLDSSTFSFWALEIWGEDQ